MPCVTISSGRMGVLKGGTDIAPCKVATLEHEVWNDTVEAGANVTLALVRGSAELLEVVGSLGHDIVEEFKVDAPGLFCVSQPASASVPLSMPPVCIGQHSHPANGWNALTNIPTLVDVGDLALAIHLHLGALPAAVEIYLDGHTLTRGVELSLVRSLGERLCTEG